MIMTASIECRNMRRNKAQQSKILPFDREPRSTPEINEKYVHFHCPK